MKLTDEQRTKRVIAVLEKHGLETLLDRVAQSYVLYDCPLLDWFKMDHEDAVELGVLKEGEKFHGYSDIRVMQHEMMLERLLMIGVEHACGQLEAYATSTALANRERNT